MKPDASPNLRNGEYVIWEGPPSVPAWILCVSGPQTALVTILSIAVLIVILRIFPKALIPFAIAQSISIIGTVAAGAFDAHGVYYGTNNQRMVRLGRALGAKPAAPETTIDRLAAGKLHDLGNGVGTLVATDGQAIHCMPNARQVFREVQRAVPAGNVPTRYKTGPIAYWSSDPFASRLERGEVYLWTGVPDIDSFAIEYQTYTKQQVQPLAISAAVLAGLISFAASFGAIASHVGSPAVLGLALGPATLGMASLVAMSRATSLYSGRQVATSVRYALTNRRALIYLSDAVAAWVIIGIDLSRLTPVTTRITGGGGTIKFLGSMAGVSVERKGAGQRSRMLYMRPYEYGFFHIHSTELAMEIIKDASANLVKAQSDTSS